MFATKKFIREFSTKKVYDLVCIGPYANKVAHLINKTHGSKFMSSLLIEN
jgi:hypothetical protein